MGSVPGERGHLSRGYDGASQLGTTAPASSSLSYTDGLSVRQPTSRPQSSLGKFDDMDHHHDDSTVQHAEAAGLHRSTSSASRSGGTTLKKKGSISRKGSLKRSGSRRSLHAGSIKGVDHANKAELNNIFYTPIPTSGSPTEVLANRFQAWRKMLKDLITYFREVQASYEHKAKALLKVSNIINNVALPAGFRTDGGLNDANNILRDYHRQAISEANKSKDIENDVITHLNGLRSDLAAKIKEIKSLSGDFKNSVDKEKEGTKKVVHQLEEALQVAEHDPSAMVGKDDPFIVKLAVDRQVERQIDEENYLHRAYLNLEGSGRELESIVVGEIQKAYNALAGILKREADEAYDTVEKLRSGPVSLPKDYEWSHFIENDPHFIDPAIPLRKVEDIDYPGKHAPAAAEVRAGMLERKSKYLKSYTPGWYVLSPTHLHEFKSADKIYTQPPIVSLFLADQKLGSRSSEDSSSHKFMIKGKQTGSMHRGHSWVFRAESYDTMLAWYSDIKTLTETSVSERNAFVRRQHTRSVSAGSVSGESVMDEDEADQVPFSAVQSREMAAVQHEELNKRPQRPSPGRFPSDLQANQHLRAPVGSTTGRPLSPSSGSSIDDRDFAVSSDAAALSSTQHTPALAQGQPQDFQPRHQSQPLSDGAATNSGSAAGAGAGDHYVSSISSTGGGNDHSGGALLVGAAAGALGGEEYWRAKQAATDRREAEQQRELEQEDAVAATLAAAREPRPDAQLTDAEKAAAAIAMPPDMNGAVLRESRGFGSTTSASVGSDAETALTSATGGIASSSAGKDSTGTGRTSVSLASVEHGGEAAGKEVVVESALQPSAAPVVPAGGAVTGSSSLSSSAANGVLPAGKHTAYDTSPVDGSVNAQPTGAIFPRVLRHNTDVSVRDLHVPGEWEG